MDEVTIYKFQLENIIEALRITSNIHNCSKLETSHDRQVRSALQYAKNALNGYKDIEVNYMTGTNKI
jgi:hypothetical protein